MMILIAFATGVFIGVTLGLLIGGLCNAAKSDELSPNWKPNTRHWGE